MVGFLLKIIKDVLTSVYQSLGFSIMLVFFAMYLFLYAYDKEYSGQGLKNAVAHWFLTFKTSRIFRKMFLLILCIALILFKTLLNRNMWANPVSNVLGSWGLYNKNGELTTENIENVMLMLPFIVFLLWTFKDKLMVKVNLKNAAWAGVKYSFLFSITIESLQLFLRLGTFQLSDLFFNTLGGLLGGVIYYIGYRHKHKGDQL